MFDGGVGEGICCLFTVMMHFLPSSPSPPLRRARRLFLLALSGWLVAFPGPTAADTVVRRDGSRVEGRVLSLDAATVRVETDGETIGLPREQVAAIHFTEPEPERPPLKVELRNVRSDDAVDVLLDEQVIIRQGREGGEWIDMTADLKDGNNPLRLRIHNDRGTWAYGLSLRINGVVTRLSCGRPLDSRNPCRCCGKTGRETGIIDDLPVIWLYVDREAGRAEVLP